MKDMTKAKEIYDYMKERLAEGVFISKKNEKEMIKEINNLIEND
jgi:flagellin-specific chaperone FliS